MAYAYPKTETFGREYPNWLGSEVGLTLKTYQLNSADVTAAANGKKIKKSGSVFTITVDESTVAVGLLYKDVDVTDGDLEVSVMVAGRVLENRLPETVSNANKTALQASGIVFATAPDVTRI